MAGHGRPVPGVTIEASGPTAIPPCTVVSNAHGEYVMQEMRVAVYARNLEDDRSTLMTLVNMANGSDRNQLQRLDPTLFSLTFDHDYRALATTHPNVLVVGSDAAVDDALGTLLGVCRKPVTTYGKRDAFVLHSALSPGTLILREVGCLSLNDQHRLMAWLEEVCGHTQIIATNAGALWPGIEKGAFLAGLYYRLNVVHFDLTSQVPAAC